MKLNSNYTVETIAGQQVLLPAGQAVIDGGSVYHLNRTAGWVLEALNREMDFEALFALAAASFQPENEEERDQLRSDLLSFLEDLRRLGLLEESGHAGH